MLPALGCDRFFVILVFASLCFLHMHFLFFYFVVGVFLSCIVYTCVRFFVPWPYGLLKVKLRVVAQPLQPRLTICHVP